MTSTAITSLAWTGERMIPGATAASTFWEHILRYRFAAQFVKGKRVADVACGEGYGTAALLAAGATAAIGVDISVESCDHARRKYGIDARPGCATQLPIESQSTDVFVSFETIEHLEQPHLFINEINRCLHTNGIAVISTPNKPVYNMSCPDNDFHHHEMDLAEFQTLLQSSFASVTLYGQSLRPVSQEYRSTLTRILNTLQKNPHIPLAWRLQQRLSRYERWLNHDRWTSTKRIAQIVANGATPIPSPALTYTIQSTDYVQLEECKYFVAICSNRMTAT